MYQVVAHTRTAADEEGGRSIELGRHLRSNRSAPLNTAHHRPTMAPWDSLSATVTAALRKPATPGQPAEPVCNTAVNTQSEERRTTAERYLTTYSAGSGTTTDAQESLPGRA